MKYVIYTDGGSRGNPGPAAIGVVIKAVDHFSLVVNGKQEVSISFGKKIGETTNNVAEYTAVIEALTWVALNKKSAGENMNDHEIHIQFFLDSTLVVNQLNGLFKVKDSNMRMLMLKVRELEQELSGNITYTYVPRERNTDADFQVNKALDGS